MRIYPAKRNQKDGWIVDWTDSTGKRNRPWFTSQSAARTFASTTKQEIQDLGESWTRLESWEKTVAAQAYTRAKAGGYSVVDACEFWERQKAVASSITVADLQEKHYQSKLALNLRKPSLNQIGVVRREFARQFGTQAAAAVTPEEISKWLNRPEWGPVRRNKVLAEVSSLFNFGVRFRYVTENPARAIERAKEDTQAPCIWTVPEVRTVLAKLSFQYQHLIPFFAVQLFGLCRRAEAEKMAWEDLHISEGTMRVPAVKSKTRVGRLVDLNETAIAWLLAYQGPRKGKLLRSIDRRNKSYNAFREECRLFQPNIVRHTALSYECARSKDMTSTAFNGGTSVGELRDHYLNLVRPPDALAFFAIKPTPVRASEEPVKSWCRPGKRPGGLYARTAEGFRKA